MVSPGHTTESLARAIGARVICNDSTQPVLHLLTDSRRLTAPEGTLFFALRSGRNDGHRYINELYAAGVRNFVVSLDYSFPVSHRHCTVIAVPDTLEALQKLAALHRQQFRIPVAGITGSNGKTSVKEWLYQLLHNEFNTVRSPKSYNSQVGVPLSVWQLHPDNNLALFEAGISKPGEMEKLQQVIQPNIGIFTGIGSAHDEGFSSREEKLNEKFRLFEGCDVLIYCKDQPEVKARALTLFEQYPLMKGISWSLHDTATIAARIVSRNRKGTTLSFTYRTTPFEFRIPFSDDASIANALTCVCFLLAVERLSPEMLERFATLQPIEMRMQMREGIHNTIVINDTYNSDLQSLKIALDFLNQQNLYPTKTIILSDILETGMPQNDLYKEVARMVEEAGIQRIIGVGKDICQHFQKFSITKKFYFNTAHLLEHFNTLDFANEIILIKGARTFEFEKVSRLLESKVHATVLEINLNALVNNLNAYRRLLKPGTKTMAMVKAFSYGSGTHEIAKALEYHRVDYLSVAYADEGIALRKAGIKLPVMVMNPEPGSFFTIAEHQLEPEIYNFFILDDLVKNIEGAEVGIHIELDCGMRRLGFDEHELDELINRLKKMPNLVVRSVFAHLAASDEPQHDDFTREQVSRFMKMSARIVSAFDYPVLRHILNSSGITRFPEAQFDMVRLGIGLYGVDPTGQMRTLENVGTLKTIVSQVRHIQAGESVGYSRKGLVTRDTTVAVVAIGYADGLDRGLSNGRGHMLIRGQRAPVLGNICMDMTMLDVTGLDCREGDEVMVFGKGIDVADLAHAADTIPYELISGISQRVQRVYFQE